MAARKRRAPANQAPPAEPDPCAPLIAVITGMADAILSAPRASFGEPASEFGPHPLDAADGRSLVARANADHCGLCLRAGVLSTNSNRAERLQALTVATPTAAAEKAAEARALAERIARLSWQLAVDGELPALDASWLDAILDRGRRSSGLSPVDDRSGLWELLDFLRRAHISYVEVESEPAKIGVIREQYHAAIRFFEHVPVARHGDVRPKPGADPRLASAEALNEAARALSEGDERRALELLRFADSCRQTHGPGAHGDVDSDVYQAFVVAVRAWGERVWIEPVREVARAFGIRGLAPDRVKTLRRRLERHASSK